MGGGGGSKSSSSSKTNFPTKFFDEAYDYFGGDPTTDPAYKPAYVGVGNLDDVESNIYAGQKSKLEDVYNNAVAKQREELSQSGLLNSPNQYLEGSARSALDKGYLSQIQQAARDAANTKADLQEQEAARETAFNTDVAKTTLNAFLQKLGLAASAGRTSKGSSSSSNPFSIGILT